MAVAFQRRPLRQYIAQGLAHLTIDIIRKSTQVDADRHEHEITGHPHGNQEEDQQDQNQQDQGEQNPQGQQDPEEGEEPPEEDEKEGEQPQEEDPQPEEGQPQPGPGGATTAAGEMTPEEAERLLDAIQEDPGDVNRRRAPATGRRPRKDW